MICRFLSWIEIFSHDCTCVTGIFYVRYQCEIHATHITWSLYGITFQTALRHNVKTLQKQAISHEYLKTMNWWWLQTMNWWWLQTMNWWWLQTMNWWWLQTIYYCINTYKMIIYSFIYVEANNFPPKIFPSFIFLKICIME